MTLTAVGQLLNEDGLAMQINKQTVRSNTPGRNFDVETRKSFRATPANNVRSRQGERIPVNIAHRQEAEIGSVAHLEKLGRHIWAVAELNHHLDPEAPWRFSVETTSTYERGSSVGTDVQITGIGVVAQTAMISLQPITLLEGGIRENARRLTYQDGALRDLVRNAATTLRERRGGPIHVRGLLDADEEQQRQYALAVEHYYRHHPLEDRWEPPGQMRYSAHRGKVLRVS